MNQSELSTSQQETLSKIYQIINKTKEVRQKMLENGDEINKRLADFSLNYDSLGTEVYGENKYDTDNQMIKAWKF